MSETVIKQTAFDIINKNMMDYSAETILNRAIPSLQDGLKPSQRLSLFVFYNHKVYNLTKSLNVVGNISAIHPHGDAYDTVVNMTQPTRLNTPLFTGNGNWGEFGSDTGAAAMRYTEVKMSEYGREMTNLLPKKLIKEIDSYDGRVKLPTVIPVKFPLITQYYSDGIAMGISSTHLSYNMLEIANIYSDVIKGKKIDTIYPDFPSGATIIKPATDEVFNIGHGSITMRAKATIEGNRIIITEFPFTVNRNKVIEKIVKIAKETTKLKEVTDVQELSGFKQGTLVEVTARKNADMEQLLAKLYKLTDLESNISANANVIDLDSGEPIMLGIPALLTKWHEWRVGVYKIELQRDIEKMRNENHLLDGLKPVLLDMEKAINIIRKTKRDKLESTLMSEFNVDKEQAVYIMNMKLYNINPEYIKDKLLTIEKNEKELLKLEVIFASKTKIDNIIIKQVQDIANKYGQPRKTEIVENVKEVKIKVEKSDKPCYIYLTQQGYAFRSYRPIEDDTLITKTDDIIIDTFQTDESKVLEIVSSNRTIVGIPVVDIPIGVKKIGTYLNSLSKYDIPDAIGYFMNDSKFVVYGFENGKMLKWKPNIKENARITKNGYSKEQELLLVTTLDCDIELSNGKKIKVVSTKNLSTTASRSAKGTYQAGTWRKNVSYKLI